MATAAQADAQSAFTGLMALTPTQVFTADLGGMTLSPGVYNFAAAGALTGTLTLAFGDTAGGEFVFQVCSSKPVC